MCIRDRDSLNQLIASSSVYNCFTAQTIPMITYQYTHEFWNNSPLPFKDLLCLQNGVTIGAFNTSNGLPIAFDPLEAEHFAVSTKALKVEDKQVELSIFPNPFSSYSNVNIRLKGGKPYHFKVYTSMGELVYNRHAADNQFVLMKSNLGTSGLYFYCLESQGALVDAGTFIIK